MFAALGDSRLCQPWTSQLIEPSPASCQLELQGAPQECMCELYGSRYDPTVAPFFEQLLGSIERWTRHLDVVTAVVNYPGRRRAINHELLIEKAQVHMALRSRSRGSKADDAHCVCPVSFSNQVGASCGDCKSSYSVQVVLSKALWCGGGPSRRTDTTLHRTTVTCFVALTRNRLQNSAHYYLLLYLRSGERRR